MSSRVRREPVRETGERIGVYRLLELLGSGSTGDVLLARDDASGTRVAIKRLCDHAESHERRRFRREARAVARLDHPAIVRIHDTFTDPAGEYLVMEYVEGETLAERIRQTGPLDLLFVARLGGEIAAGLAAAHRQAILHRDLKAENVMITADGHAKILDFGLAKELETGPGQEDSLTQTGMILGTWRVMSPEQAGGQRVDARSDLFSLGVLLYEMVTARSPFRGEHALATLRNILTRRPEPVSSLRAGVPAGLSTLIDRLLCKEPEKRPAGADLVVHVLERVANREKRRRFLRVFTRPGVAVSRRMP